MSKQTEALKLALEALKYISSHYMSLPKIGCMALAAVEEALAEQPAQQEPVAMRYDFDGYGWKYIDSGSGSDWQTRIKDAEPIYTTPPQRTWVGLTDEERMDVLLALNWDKQLTHMDTAKAIEAKLKEKNT